MAASILLEVVNDLEGSPPRWRADALLHHQTGVGDSWMDALGLGQVQARRVWALLAELAG